MLVIVRRNFGVLPESKGTILVSVPYFFAVSNPVASVTMNLEKGPLGTIPTLIGPDNHLARCFVRPVPHTVWLEGVEQVGEGPRQQGKLHNEK